MPISVLPELAAAFGRAGLVLTPWSRLAMLEEQILRRSRSAFLVHWFGRGVPTLGVDLHIEIANIDPLRLRYLEVGASAAEAGPELNLLGPLSGIAGLIVGMAMSPSGAILIATQARRISGLLVDGGENGVLPWLYWLVGTWLLPALGPAVGILAIPLAVTGAIVATVGGSRELKSLYLLLGEVAMLIDAIVRFWDLLSGPRSAIRNPLLERILGVLDRFAGLFAQVLGFVSLIVTRVARLLPWLMGQFRAFAGLAEAVLFALGDILGNAFETLMTPFDAGGGILEVVGRVFDTLVEIPETLMRSVTALVNDFIAQVTTAFGAIARTIETFVTDLRTRIIDALGQTVVGALVARIRRLLEILPAVSAAFTSARAARTTTPGEPPPSPFMQGLGFVLTGGLWGSLGGIQSSLGDLFGSMHSTRTPPLPTITVPPLPTSPSTASLDEIMTRVGRPDTSMLSARLSAEAAGALARPAAADILRDPASLFEHERRALEQSAPPPQLQLDDERVRDMIYTAVGRVLPPALRTYGQDVRAFFDIVDEQVYRVEREPLRQPMLDLDDSGRLRPVVHMLTVRSFGGFEPDVRGFRDLLVQELNARTYMAPHPP